MDIRTLEYFMDIAETRSFSVAAERKNISQSSLSKAIIRLENELNVRLFDRKAHPICLTPAGEQLYEDLRDLMPRFAGAMRNLRPYSARKRVSAVTVPNDTFYNLRYEIQRFCVENPAINASLYTERHCDAALSLLESGEVDFIVAHQPLRQYPDITSTFLCDDPLYAVMPSTHPLACNSELDISKLNGEKLMETSFGVSVVDELRDFYRVRFGDVVCRPGLHRDAVLQALRFEDRIMICYESDIAVFNLDRHSKVRITGIRPQPYVLMELSDAPRPEHLRRFRTFLIQEVFGARK